MVGTPQITSPANGLVTNQAAVTVEGTSVDGATVTVYNGGTAAGSATAEGGRFAIPVTLNEGDNSLTAAATVAAGETRPSAPVVVSLDTVAPSLTVTTPTDGLVTNREVLTVSGTAADDHMAAVTVNGEPAALASGAFSQKVILSEGSNDVTVMATDLASNSTAAELHVTLDSTAPALSDVLPASDVTLTEGESTTISFRSEPGLPQVGYRIILTGGASSNPTAMGAPNMTETAPGLYEGTYTAPSGTTFSAATVSVWASDAAGNYAEANAAGRLTVTTPNQAPVAQITLPKNMKVDRPVTFDGSKSSDPDGTIVSYVWTFLEQGQTLEGPRPPSPTRPRAPTRCS
ncbi:MAG: Ig-like domain-containing protein [Bacillota bacterium]